MKLLFTIISYVWIKTLRLVGVRSFVWYRFKKEKAFPSTWGLKLIPMDKSYMVVAKMSGYMPKHIPPYDRGYVLIDRDSKFLGFIFINDFLSDLPFGYTINAKGCLYAQHVYVNPKYRGLGLRASMIRQASIQFGKDVIYYQDLNTKVDKKDQQLNDAEKFGKSKIIFRKWMFSTGDKFFKENIFIERIQECLKTKHLIAPQDGLIIEDGCQ